MDRKKLAQIAAICGAVTFIAVLLPWAVITVDLGPMGALAGAAGVESSKSYNGTEGDFQGTFVLILGLVGGAAAAMVFLGKTDIVPLDERQHLFAAVGCFGLALLLVFLDFVSNAFGSEGIAGFGSASSGRGLGIWLALLATAGGGVTAFLATKQPASGGGAKAAAPDASE